jgi:hypothetical protein
MACKNEAERTIKNVSEVTCEEENDPRPSPAAPESSPGRANGKLPVLCARYSAPTALASAGRVRFMRAEIVRCFGEDAGRLVDELAPAASAAARAARRRDNTEESANRGKLWRELRERYTSLRIDARRLVQRKLLERRVMNESGLIHDYPALAQSVLALVVAFRAAWSEIDRKSFLKLEDIDAAETLATELLDAVAKRDEARESTGANEEWERAMLHLFTVNQDVRAMVTVLRWCEGDVDALIPSLSATRTERGSYRAYPIPERTYSRKRMRMGRTSY